MKKTAKLCGYIFPILFVFVLALAIFLEPSVSAAVTDAHPGAITYEMPSDLEFTYGEAYRVDKMSFGAATAGDFTLSGSVSGKTVFRGTEAYAISGTVEFNYYYNNNTLCQQNAEVWEVWDNGGKKVNGIDLGAKIERGAIIIQKSANKVVWNTEYMATNVFETPNANALSYKPLEADLKQGMYYRVTVAYELRHQTGTIMWVIPTYEYKKCVETYEFYLAIDNQSVSVKDFVSGAAVKNGESIAYGFTVNDGKTGNLIAVTVPGAESPMYVKSGKTFYEPGVYTVVETTKLGNHYTTQITVERGLDTEAVGSEVYESNNGEGYGTSANLKTDTTVFGSTSYTSVHTVVPKGDRLEQAFGKTLPTVGVFGSEVYLMLKIHPERLGSDWVVSYDEWGTVENEKVNGVFTGTVGSGAVVVQKSKNGTDWQFCSGGSYANGVFTTDFEAEFGANGEVCVYVPSGEEVILGYQYRIFYAYEVKNVKNGQCVNIVEVYNFKLINGNLEAVTFHNLTLSDASEELDKEGESLEATIAKLGETLINGSVTVTGFEIDLSLNAAVEIAVSRNGAPYTVPADMKISEDGRYDITVSNDLGAKKHVTVYVCKLSMEELYTKLFGEDFLTGKRIFSQGTLPVYEAGLTELHLAALGEYDVRPILVIRNETWQTFETVTWTDAQTIELNMAGQYTVSVYTNDTFAYSESAGDNHSFVFRFELIENGTAPGPVVNREILQKHGNSNSPTNAGSVYYGVSFLSASRGYITLAFASERDAYKYVYNQEKNMVEVQPDGSFRYNGNFFVSQKEKYVDGWELADAIDFFTKLAIKKCYFDLSDEFTYLTLTQDVIESVENLRTLELDKSVVVFAEGQAELLLARTGLPLLNSMKYAYLTPGREGVVDRGYYHFEFIKDKYGYDSASVTVIDCNGKRYIMEYNRSVEEQLRAQGCPTGIVTVEEKTVYGDTTQYQAIYIAENDNTISFDLKYYVGEQEYIKNISSANNGERLIVNMFSLENVIDQLNDYGLIRINDGKTEYFYSAADPDIKNRSYPAVGVYEISVVNRLGYAYTFTVEIEESNYYVVNIKKSADGESVSFIYTDDGIVILPDLTKYGYILSGYKAEDGTVINKEIEAVALKGYTVLEAVWEAKKFKLNLYVGDSLYYTADVVFGESFVLPSPTTLNGAEFVGWGDDLLLGEFTLDKEGDISLTAQFKNQEAEGTEATTASPNSPNSPDEPGGSDTENPEKSKGKPAWAWVLLSVIAIAGGVLVVIYMCLDDEDFLWMLILGLILAGGAICFMLFV